MVVTVASASRGRSRTRGEIEQLPSGALRIRVYAGIDPVSKKKHYLGRDRRQPEPDKPQ